MNYNASESEKFITECKAAIFQPGITNSKIKQWKENAEKGDSESMHYYGIVLIAQDKVLEGVRLIESSARSGSGKAAYNTGRAYMSGLGVKKDIGKSAQYFTLACENGFSEAIPMLFFMLTKANKFRAVFRLLKRFSLGHGPVAAQAKYQIGLCHINGLGTKANKGLGTEYIKRSALMHNADAQYALSHFMMAERTPRVIEAAVWRLKAAMSGHEEALSSLNPLLDKANRQVKKFKKSLLQKRIIN